MKGQTCFFSRWYQNNELLTDGTYTCVFSKAHLQNRLSHFHVVIEEKEIRTFSFKSKARYWSTISNFMDYFSCPESMKDKLSTHPSLLILQYITYVIQCTYWSLLSNQMYMSVYIFIIFVKSDTNTAFVLNMLESNVPEIQLQNVFFYPLFVDWVLDWQVFMRYGINLFTNFTFFFLHILHIIQ